VDLVVMRGIRPILALCAMLMIDPAAGATRLNQMRAASARFASNDEGALSLSSGINFALGLVGSILAAMLAMIVVAALFGDYVDSVRDVNENLTAADFGDDTTNSIAPIFAIVVGVSALAGLVGIIVYAVTQKVRG
jgi:hypothetical protein